MTRTRWMAIVIVGIAGLTSLEIAWPSYPSTKSLCRVMDERAVIHERSASPHVGAIIAFSGMLYGGPNGELALQCDCEGFRQWTAIDSPPLWLASSPEWKQLRNETFPKTDHLVRVQMVGRVASQYWGCFNLGMVVQPLLVAFDGPVRTVQRSSGVKRETRKQKPEEERKVPTFLISGF